MKTEQFCFLGMLKGFEKLNVECLWSILLDSDIYTFVLNNA
jgi:hypothetical protein